MPVRRTTRTISIVAIVAAVSALIVVPAVASARPIVTGLSTHRGPYWGGTSVTVSGRNLTGVESVTFGSATAWSVQAVSSTELTVTAPWHDYDHVYVRVTTSAGRSERGPVASFVYTRPSMNDPIQGGMTARQEQRRSAQVRADHKNAHVAAASQHWTPAMGESAVRRAESWLGVPYSWDGGDGSGPTTGVCAHNGGDLDCHVVGFDCSGLTLYSWWPYEHLAHHAATQHGQAGRFHPGIKQLVPGDLVYFAGWAGATIDHTAIYAGDGMVIQAPESGEQVMRSRLVDVIAASGAYRGATRPMTTGRPGAGPQVTSVTSTVSAAGGKFTITGRGLTGVTSVTIGHSTQYTFASQTSRRLVLTAPAHTAGTVQVAVANAWATVRRTTTYVAAPTLTALSPATGTTAGGTVVTLTGQDLTDRTTATVAGTPVDLDVLSSTRARLVVPAHRAGTVRVVLHSPYGRSAAETYTYVVTVPPPTSSPSTTPTSTTPTPTTSAPVTSTSTTPAPTTSTPVTSAPTSSATTVPTSSPSSTTAATTTASTPAAPHTSSGARPTRSG